MIINQIEREGQQGFRFILSAEGEDVSSMLDADEYVATTADAEGHLGGRVTISPALRLGRAEEAAR